MKKLLSILLIYYFCIQGANASIVDEYGIIPVKPNKNYKTQKEEYRTIQELPKDTEDTIYFDVNKIQDDYTPPVLTPQHGTHNVASEELKINDEDVAQYNKIPKMPEISNPDGSNLKKTASYKKEKKLKKATIGTQYDTTFSPDTASQTRTLYSKYDVTDNVSVTSSYKNNSFANPTEQFKGSMSISPEFQLGKRVSIQNNFSKNIGSGETKEEVALKINPFKDKDRMDLKAGIGQVQYTSGPPSSSQINFGTNIKF